MSIRLASLVAGLALAPLAHPADVPIRQARVVDGGEPTGKRPGKALGKTAMARP